MIRRRAYTACSSIALLSLLAMSLTGCAWVGAGRDVGEALQKSAQVKTAKFSGTVTYAISGLPGAPEGRSIQMNIDGAYDEADPTAPKSRLQMNVPGLMNIGVITVGDGNKYLVTNRGSYGAPIDDKVLAAETAGMTKVFEALESAIGGFREGAPSHVDTGEQLRTIFAEGDVGNICEDVWPEFAATMEASSGGGSIGEVTGGENLADSCRKILKTNPKLWFGIDDGGVLRMLAIEAEIAVAGTPAKMKVTIRIDITPTDRVPSITKPAGVRMLGSYAELQKLEHSAATGD